jgi:hypothetical protein
LSPIVTAGLPTPGPLLAGAEVAVGALELELLDDEVLLLLLPHAERPTASASAAAAPAINARVLLVFLAVIRRLLLVGLLCSS